jgi:hypothetical protein
MYVAAPRVGSRNKCTTVTHTCTHTITYHTYMIKDFKFGQYCYMGQQCAIDRITLLGLWIYVILTESHCCVYEHFMSVSDVISVMYTYGGHINTYDNNNNTCFIAHNKTSLFI